jgi:hypothetical protein
VPATLVDATFHATADAGSIPAVSTHSTRREVQRIRVGCRAFPDGLGAKKRERIRARSDLVSIGAATTRPHDTLGAATLGRKHMLALAAPVWDRYGQFAGQPAIRETVTWAIGGRGVVIAGRRAHGRFEELVR